MKTELGGQVNALRVSGRNEMDSVRNREKALGEVKNYPTDGYLADLHSL